MRYDIAVIGNDESAFEMLTLAACSGKRTVAILPETRHSSWLVGQALRRLITNLLVDHSPHRNRMFQQAGTPRLMHSLIARSIVKELNDYIGELEDQCVDVVLGEARFASKQTLHVQDSLTNEVQTIKAQNVVIGTGVRQGPMHQPGKTKPFFGPEALLSGTNLPPEVCVLGGGHFGAGIAALASLFGSTTGHVTRDDESSVMLELAAAAGVQIGTHPAEVGLPELNSESSDSNGRLQVIDCRRSIGFTNHLGLDRIFVEPDENGQLWCASSFETWCSGVFGIGDVVGFSPDTTLHPSIQAERVFNQTRQTTRRPHMLNSQSGVELGSTSLRMP